jgi:hypothetical protein
MAKKVTQHRSAISGRFVTKRYAELHRRTTVTERNRKPTRSSGK